MSENPNASCLTVLIPSKAIDWRMDAIGLAIPAIGEFMSLSSRETMAGSELTRVAMASIEASSDSDNRRISSATPVGDGSRPDATPAAARGAQPTEETDGSSHSRAMVGHTVAEVEQQLILETLSHCLGNRTHAANILGISIRTLRNKLNLYSADGVDVPTPGEGQRLAG